MIYDKLLIITTKLKELLDNPKIGDFDWEFQVGQLHREIKELYYDY